MLELLLSLLAFCICYTYRVYVVWALDEITSIIFCLTVVDCGALSNPVNGSVHYTAGTTFRQKANYSCNTGYNLVGDNTRTCEATGEWSGSAPTCQGVLSLTHTCACVYVVGASIWLYPSVCIKLEGILFFCMCIYPPRNTTKCI